MVSALPLMICGAYSRRVRFARTFWTARELFSTWFFLPFFQFSSAGKSGEKTGFRHSETLIFLVSQVAGTQQFLNLSISRLPLYVTVKSQIAQKSLTQSIFITAPQEAGAVYKNDLRVLSFFGRRIVMQELDLMPLPGNTPGRDNSTSSPAASLPGRRYALPARRLGRENPMRIPPYPWMRRCCP